MTRRLGDEATCNVNLRGEGMEVGVGETREIL